MKSELKEWRNVRADGEISFIRVFGGRGRENVKGLRGETIKKKHVQSEEMQSN